MHVTFNIYTEVMRYFPLEIQILWKLIKYKFVVYYTN